MQGVYDLMEVGYTASQNWELFVAPELLSSEDPRAPLYSSTNMPFEGAVALKPVLLPMFLGASAKLVLDIRTRETEAFGRFQIYLRKLTKKLADDSNSSIVREILDELDDEVARLNFEAKKLQRLRVLRDASFISFGISILTSFVPELKAFSGIIGSASLLSAVQSMVGSANAHDTIRQSAFYIPFLVRREQESRKK
jgi:hypothetical protein